MIFLIFVKIKIKVKYLKEIPQLYSDDYEFYLKFLPFLPQPHNFIIAINKLHLLGKKSVLPIVFFD